MSINFSWLLKRGHVSV